MKEKSLYLKVRDHSVSGEEFQLLRHEDLELLETYPQPSPEKITEYYNSEDYISHTDNRRNFVERAYHVIKSITLKRKLSLINVYSSNGKDLLDFGCGTGDFLNISQKGGWNIKGVEPNEKARKVANHKTNGYVFGAEELSKFEKGQFDVITLWHVFEHLPNLDYHIINFKNLLKPEGVLIVAVPNYKSYDASYYKEFWAAFDVPRHFWHFSKNTMTKLFERNQMKIVKTLPMVFDAYYVSLLSEKYKSGFMNPIKAFFVGLCSNLKAKRNGEYSSLIYIIKNIDN